MSNQTQNTDDLPTTPDWTKAPEWAKWFAINKNGKGFWFAKKPWKAKFYWDSAGKEQSASGEFESSNWENSLQQRPISTTLEMGNPNHKSHPFFAKPKIEGLKPDGVWIDEAEHFADVSEIKPPRTFSETATVYFNSEITGYLAGKNSFITGIVDLLLARMAKEERFSDGDINDKSLIPTDFDICKIRFGNIGEHLLIILKAEKSGDDIKAISLGIKDKQAWGFTAGINVADDDVTNWIRTITELEAVEFRKTMEAVYG